MSMYIPGTPSDKIAALVREMHANGHRFPLQVSDLDIENIANYEQLMKEIHNNQLQMYRKNIPIEGIHYMRPIAGRWFWFVRFVGHALFFGSPILAIILSITYSWWFLIIIFLSVVGSRWMGLNHEATLLKSAMRSETEFCYLFSVGIVGLKVPSIQTEKPR
ncbi:MAG: hypothetical protein WCR20_23105 [Verrucomicrobiota bacterium]